MKTKIISIVLLSLLMAVSCKKKTTQPNTPDPTPTPAPTTKVVGMSYVEHGTFGASTGSLYVNWDYDYKQYAGSPWVTQPSPLLTSTNVATYTTTIPIAADSMYYGFVFGMGTSNYAIDYTLTINGNAIKTASHAISGAFVAYQ